MNEIWRTGSEEESEAGQSRWTNQTKTKNQNGWKSPRKTSFQRMKRNQSESCCPSWSQKSCPKRTRSPSGRSWNPSES